MRVSGTVTDFSSRLLLSVSGLMISVPGGKLRTMFRSHDSTAGLVDPMDGNMVAPCVAVLVFTRSRFGGRSTQAGIRASVTPAAARGSWSCVDWQGPAAEIVGGIDSVGSGRRCVN